MAIGALPGVCGDGWNGRWVIQRNRGFRWGRGRCYRRSVVGEVSVWGRLGGTAGYLEDMVVEAWECALRSGGSGWCWDSWVRCHYGWVEGSWIMTRIWEQTR